MSPRQRTCILSRKLCCSRCSSKLSAFFTPETSSNFSCSFHNHHINKLNIPTSITRDGHPRKLPRNIQQFQSHPKFQEKMDIRFMGFDAPLIHSIQNMLETDDSDNSKSISAPTRTYVRDARAMAATPADIKEYPNSYVFVIDMPGLKSGDIKVQVEDDNVLLISGERKREEEKEGAKFVRMERRIGKFMRKFVLPENANTEKISAVCQDGVLTVTVEKLPPPEPKKPKTIEVKIA